MLDRLSEEQKAELVRRYLAGESPGDLARDPAIPYSESQIRKYLRSSLGTTRSVGEGVALARNCSIHAITAAALEAIYWGPDRPSMSSLARRFGCTDFTIARYLDRKGIYRRSASEQHAIDLKLGRRVPAKPTAKCRSAAAAAIRGRPGPFRGRRHTAEAKRQGAEARLRRRLVPCAWCGARLERQLHDVQQKTFSACSRAEGCLYRGFIRKHGPDAPRPLIVEALWRLAEADRAVRERVKSGRGIGTWLPHTPERLAKLGAAIGAWEPEIEAVIERQIEESEALLAKAVAA